jgi:hypothetical protein
MLNDPIISPLSRVRNHGGQSIHAAYDMDVQMVNLLPAYAPGIDYRTEAIGTPLLPGQLRYEHHHFAQQVTMHILDFRQRADVQLGYQHEMYRRRRMDIVERKNICIVIYFIARNFSAHNLAKNTVVHFLSCFPRSLLVYPRNSFAPP